MGVVSPHVDTLRERVVILTVVVDGVTPRIGPRPEYIPSRLTGLVPALSIYPPASPDWSPP
eukprot:3916394-Pyramimonas_sp.AAC.2